MQKVIIHTDGGARGNPGVAGAGIVFSDEKGKILKEFSFFLGEGTNNWAEYKALILALQEAKKVFGAKASEIHFECRLDSELVQRQLSGIYQVKEETLFPLFMEIWNLRVKNFPHVSFHHVRREENKQADELANKAMDQGR